MRHILLIILFLSTLFANYNSINLKKGWQIVGFSNTKDDLSFLDKNISLAWTYDTKSNKWLAYSPKKKISKLIDLDTNIDQIKSIKPWQGVWLKANEDGYLSSPYFYDKPKNTTSNTLELLSGWNLISLPINTTISPKLFESMTVWKYSDTWKLFTSNPEHPLKDDFPTIDTLDANDGFWIYTKDKKTIDISERSSKLVNFDSSKNMKNYISSMISSTYIPNMYKYTLVDMPMESVMMDTVSASVSEKTNDITVSNTTSTNTQEDDVDESDIIKHDGTNIFYLSQYDNKIYVSNFSNIISNNTKASISIDTSKDANVESMYINNNKLIIIYSPKYYSYRGWQNYTDFDFWNRKSKIEVYDISNIDNISKINTIEIEGRIITSRITNNKLYVISRFQPHNEYEYTNGDYNNPIIKNSYLLPIISIDGNTKDLISHDKLYAPLKLDQACPIISTTTFDLDNINTMENISIIGETSTQYVSSDAIYLVSQNYPMFYDFWNYKERSVIYKIDINDHLSYNSKGFVDGRVLNEFSLSEYKNTLRIATTEGFSWGSNGTNNSIYTLQSKDKSLNIVGKLHGLGKKDEMIKSVRFIGSRGFIVTFKQTDPFYTIDLSDATNPKKVGELSIDGFSEYLHPIDENRILSIGRDANKDGIRLGLQIELFDISDFKNPKLAQKIKVGDKYTYSEAEYNHHAFTYRSSDNTFAFPISSWYKSSYNNTLNLFSIDNLKITKLGELKAPSIDNSYYYGQARSIIFDVNNEKYVVYFVNGSFIASKIDELKIKKEDTSIISSTPPGVPAL